MATKFFLELDTNGNLLKIYEGGTVAGSTLDHAFVPSAVSKIAIEAPAVNKSAQFYVAAGELKITICIPTAIGSAQICFP